METNKMMKTNFWKNEVLFFKKSTAQEVMKNTKGVLSIAATSCGTCGACGGGTSCGGDCSCGNTPCDSSSRDRNGI